MSRRLLLPILSVLAAVSGCAKLSTELSDEPFSIEIKTVQSKSVWVDLVPENNDFGYSFGSVTVKDYEDIYGNDEALVKARDKEIKDFWEKNLKEHLTFRESYLYTGAYFIRSANLEPDTDYYFFAFPYDKNDNPVVKVVKQRFRTCSYKESDIDFTLSLTGSVISITPSNDADTYYYDYDKVSEIEKDFSSSPSLFYYYLVSKYEEYGFMQAMTVKGPATSDMANYFSLKPGETFYFVGSGYENGINSPYRVFKLTYAGEGLPGTVETGVIDPLMQNKNTRYEKNSLDRICGGRSRRLLQVK